MYIYQLPDWPRFKWNGPYLAGPLAAVHYHRGRLAAHVEALDIGLRQESVLKTLTADALKTGELEGIVVDAGQVGSSVAQRLEVDVGPLKPVERRAEAIVEMVLDATRNFDKPLTTERLFAWHASLFPDGRSGSRKSTTGAWRDRGGVGATASFILAEGLPAFTQLPAVRLPEEMKRYLDWFNSDAAADPVVKAGIAHLGFVAIQPFDAGNGLIARAIADMALARSESSANRFYSMSAQISLERSDYLSMLEKTLQGTMDITPWLDWFVGCLSRAIDGAQITLQAVLVKGRFWQANSGVAINERQRRVLNRFLDRGTAKISTSQYARFTKCSHDTALRDILPLVERGILVRNPTGGRSTSYSLGQLS